MRARAATVAAVLLGAAGACRHVPPVVQSGDLRVDHAWATASPDSTGGTVYFTLHNAGAVPDTVLAFSVDSAPAILHTVTRSGAMMEMVPVERPELPAHGALTLTPGHLHVMFDELRRKIGLGDTVRVTLSLARHGPLTFALVIGPYRLD